MKYNVFFQGRNTGTVVDAKNRQEAIQKARKKKVAGHRGPVVAAKLLQGKDLRDANKGRWVRTRADGSRSTGKGTYKYRRQLKPKKGKGKKF